MWIKKTLVVYIRKVCEGFTRVVINICRGQQAEKTNLEMALLVRVQLLRIFADGNKRKFLLVASKF